MKRIIILGLFLWMALFSPAQEQKLRVAVFDPAISGKNFDDGMGVIIRELVSSVIVNTGKYIIIERSLIDKILNEQKFSNSGAVDDSQISQLGKLAGANKVILAVLSSAGDKGLLSLKMIDVESAGVESQKTKLVKHSEILDIITSLALETIGEAVPTEEKASDVDAGSKLQIRNLFKKKPTSKEQSAERMNSEGEVHSPTSTKVEPTTVADGNTSLIFSGFNYSKNPRAEIFLDGQLVGNGTLNQGFTLILEDIRQGAHAIRIEWSNLITSKTYDIDTRFKQQFVFEYAKTGFGYTFRLKD
jgi:hypothetical protein